MDELKEWLRTNAERLAGYTVEEIARVALAAGLDRFAVTQWQTAEKFRRMS